LNVLFSATGWEDYQFWLASDRAILDRLNRIIEDARRSPFQGLGKPEPLKGNLKGFWSRRLTTEHRLVYRVVGTGPDQRIEIAACRYHYT
jgi:toxin YoeB